MAPKNDQSQESGKNSKSSSGKSKDSKNNRDASVKPDPETLHTTDPQEHMKGPVSSLVQDVKKEAEKGK